MSSIRDALTGKTPIGTNGTKTEYDAVFTDKKENSVSVQDFLNLMVAQLKNQDFTNPVDDTQYVTQLAQFATMQQMQELAAHSKSNYVTSLLGKEVTVAKYGLGGTLLKATGPVEKISLVNNEYKIFVKGNAYTLEQIMELNANAPVKGDGESQVDPSGLSVTTEDITTDSVTLKWAAPTSNTSITEKLKYNVYYSTNENMDKVADIEANGERIGVADRKDLTSESLKGLKPDTDYYVNVVITDGNGVKSVYQKVKFHTLKEGESV